VSGARAVAIGYASLDRAIRVEALPAPDTTAIVRRRLSDPWPSPAGCGPAIAHALAVAGVPSGCVSWVADDLPGRELRGWLRAAGVDVRGVALVGSRTAESMLIYDASGACSVIYDPGDAVVGGLDDAQRALVAGAELVCVSVGYAGATRDALDALSPEARLVWSVKADADAFPPDLVARLLARADAIALSRGERDFVARQAPGAAPRPDALVVETRGADGAVWTRGDERGSAPAQPLRATDTTGAGDAFVGGLVTGLLEDFDDARAAVARAIDTSAALLRRRALEEETA